MALPVARGKFRRAVESASASLDASVADYDDTLVTLLGDVATNYVQLRVAEQYVREFGKLAKEGNTLVVPSNLADVASMLALAMNVVKRQGDTGPAIDGR